ncbi:hypothetical protein Droror1_Dr00000144 [Drosera rotundifolia]
MLTPKNPRNEIGGNPNNSLLPTLETAYSQQQLTLVLPGNPLTNDPEIWRVLKSEATSQTKSQHTKIQEYDARSTGREMEMELKEGDGAQGGRWSKVRLKMETAGEARHCRLGSQQNDGVDLGH